MDVMGYIGFVLYGLFCLYLGIVAGQHFLPPPHRPLATGIRLSLRSFSKGAFRMTPGNYVLAAEAIPAGAILTGLTFATSDPAGATVTQQAGDPTKADVVIFAGGSATLRADAFNAAGDPVSGTIDVSGDVVATGIGLTLTPA